MATSFVTGGGIHSLSISAFDPRTLGGCVLWLDAADSNTLYSASTGTFPTATGTTLAAVGDNVVLWSDKSGQTNNATRNTDSSVAAFGSLLTGIPGTMITNGIRFGNLGSFRLDGTKLPIGSSPITVFIVAKSADNANRYALLHIGQNSANARFIQVSKSATEGVLFGNNSSGNYPNSGTFNVNQTFITTGMISGGTSTSNNFIIGGWINGTPFSSNNNFDGMSLNLSVDNVYAAIGGASFGYKGDISEILIFNRALQNDERQQVEGYLAWKWGLVQNLPTNHPYYYSKVPQSIFQPTSFPSCTLWLDAADENTVIRSGSNVTQWNDKSGNGTNLVSNASFLRPTYISNERSLNFTAVVSVSSTVLENTSVPAITSNSITVFGVYKRIAQASGATTTYQRFISASSSSASDNASINGFNINTNNTNTQLSYERNSSTLVTNATTTSSFILSFVLNGTASGVGSFAGNTQYIFQNGSQLTSGTGLSNGSAFNIQRIRLGNAVQNGGTPATEPYNGTISEVLFYSTILTPFQVQQVEGYLAWKWSLQENLPSTHPFTLANYFFNNTRPFSRYFSPTDIEDCLLWIDAADASTVTLTSSKVTTVKDKSGLGNDASNASSILTYTDTINGLNTITCPAGADSNTNNLITSIVPRDQFNHSYFIVVRYSATATGQTRYLQMTNQFFGHSASGSAGSFQIYLEDSNSVANSGTQYAFHSGTYETLNAAFGGNTFICAGVRQNSVYTITFNGVTISSNTNSNGTGLGSVIGNTSTTAYTLRPPSNSGAIVGGQLAEVIIYNRGLTAPERQIVEGYLAWKWGVANGRTQVLANNTFPTTHPYASYPPVSIPMPPSAKTFKKTFDPADLSPVLWFDPQDSSTYAVNANNRLTSWTSKGSNTLQLGSITGVNGPLITISGTGATGSAASGTAVSQGTNLQFADFSSGGYFQITGAQLTTTTNLRLTLASSPHNIPATRQVTFSNLTGTVGAITLASYLPNASYIVVNPLTSTIDISVTANGSTTGTFSGVNGAVEYGNISISSANVGATSVTITTTQSHGLVNGNVVTVNFTAGTLPVTGDASSLNAAYIVTKINDTQITVPLVSVNTGSITGPVGVLIFPSTGCGLNWTGTPVTSTTGGTLVCVTHLPRTPVRNSTLRNSFISASTTNGNAAGDATGSNGTDFKITLDNTGAAIRKNGGITASIGNTQLTAGFNVMNTTFSNTAVTGADITTGRNGLAVKGWRYDTALSNSSYNAISAAAPSSSLSLAQIRIGGNTNAGEFSPPHTHWYEGGLGDVFFFDRVLTLDERQLLEGWLSQKYTCNNTLGSTAINTSGPTGGSSIHQYRLNPTIVTGQNTLGTPITSPTQISNSLAAWFDATYSPTLSTSTSSFTNAFIPNNTAIAAWGSRAGFWSQTIINGAGCVVQLTAARRPLYITNSVNGLPGIRFSASSGNDSALDTTSSSRLEYLIITQDANPNTTLFMVVNPISTPAANGTILNVGQVTGGNYGLGLVFNTNRTVTFTMNNPSTTQSVASSALTLGQPYIIVAIRRGREMLIKTIGSGGSTTTSNPANFSMSGSSSAYLRVGNNYGGGSNPFTGDINEFMLFRTGLPNQAVQHIEGYLAHKWGLQGSLPATHAYKSFSP